MTEHSLADRTATDKQFGAAKAHACDAPAREVARDGAATRSP
jgi:hypothetical protein